MSTLSADNKDEVRFICLEDSRYYVCDKDGLGEELVFEEAMNFVGVAEVEGKTTFFCRDLNELVIVECTPRVLQEVDFDW